ncbi:MAG: hypothetical protein HQL15_00615 [Candidatus Omnitrophica bacterium]|nr:hypothetical protein [Candidatus Omnitrophota bacterium]
MHKKYKIISSCFFYLLFLGGLLILPYPAQATSNPYNETGFDIKHTKMFNVKPDKVNSVQLEADQVQFSKDNAKAIASGNVVVTADKSILYADKIELEKAIGEGVANGHVYIDSNQMQIDADSVKYNFSKGTGVFKNARVFNSPFQIKGEQINKVSEDHMIMEHGFLTTCDFDEPHYRMSIRQLDIYQGDKAIARGVTLFLGKMPIMHVSKYVQNLKDRPIFVVTPGYKKDFGAFLLTELRLQLSDQVKLIVHGDLRERTGIGEGVDVKYTTPDFGAGVLRTYYANENAIASKHLWDMRDSTGMKKGPTITHELYKIEWRHKWQIDRNTSAVWQYYKVHDWDLANMGFIKRYFQRDFRRGPDVNTYFLFTRSLPSGVISYRIDASRVNPALQSIDRFPEIRYDLSGQKLGSTNFYLKTTDMFSNFQNSQPDNHMKTMRVDTNNEISYPIRIGFVETRPFVGGEHTYYSRTNNVNERSVVRGQFKTGIDLTTHFYRIWNYHSKLFGVENNGLRHVVTPSVSYLYAHRPTINASHFNQFDSIDALAQAHSVHLSLENKLQTKRNNQSVDLIRWILETDYSLLGSEPGRSFGPYLSTLEFNPIDWLTFRTEESYNHQEEYWNYINFDAYIHKSDKWSFGIGKRFAHHVDDQFTTDLMYKINPKWKFKIYDRFLVSNGTIKEEEYILTRDLHEWEMDLDYHQERGNGIAFLVAFRLKAFPNMISGLFSNSFHQPKAGSQSTLPTN